MPGQRHSLTLHDGLPSTPGLYYWAALHAYMWLVNLFQIWCGWCVCLSVCMSVGCAKIAEQIEMPFVMWTRLGPRNYVLVGGVWIPLGKRPLRGISWPIVKYRKYPALVKVTWWVAAAMRSFVLDTTATCLPVLQWFCVHCNVAVSDESGDSCKFSLRVSRSVGFQLVGCSIAVMYVFE